VPSLVTQTRETEGGLTTTTVFLGQVDGEFVEDFAGVAREETEEGAVTVHDDESEAGVGFEELGESFCVEFVVAEVEGSGIEVIRRSIKAYKE
jgi:hypothetical protein